MSDGAAHLPAFGALSPTVFHLPRSGSPLIRICRVACACSRHRHAQDGLRGGRPADIGGASRHYTRMSAGHLFLKGT
jgi:hypothetical protein